MIFNWFASISTKWSCFIAAILCVREFTRWNLMFVRLIGNILPFWIVLHWLSRLNSSFNRFNKANRFVLLGPSFKKKRESLWFSKLLLEGNELLFRSCRYCFSKSSRHFSEPLGVLIIPSQKVVKLFTFAHETFRQTDETFLSDTLKENPLLRTSCTCYNFLNPATIRSQFFFLILSRTFRHLFRFRRSSTSVRRLKLGCHWIETISSQVIWTSAIRVDVG